jgi:hypothetical protein
MLETAADDFLSALAATTKSGRLEGGATMQIAPGSITVVAGAHVKDSDKFEAGLRKLEAARKKKDAEFDGFKWNAARHRDITFHTMSVPIPEEQEAPRHYFGEKADIAFGIGPEAVYLAIGRDHLDAVKQAIDASAAEPDKAVPPFELAISLTPFVEIIAVKADGDQQKVLENVAEMLRNEAAGRDHIRIDARRIPNGLRHRIEAEEGVLRALGKMYVERQRQALEEAQKQAQ